MNIAKLFILTVFGFSRTRSFEWNEPIDYDRAEIIAKMIFPNMTQIYNQNSRRLPYNPKPVKQVPCIICQNLKVCSALNKLLIEEKYYPNNLNLLGTCWIIEDLAKRVQKEVFGNGRTFRDTPLCRDIVMQYLCLFWGSDNQMYKNLCAWQEDVSSPNPADHIIAPKPPCRSFCVQVADICANDPDFIKLCNNIQCPPTEDECSPGLSNFNYYLTIMDVILILFL